MSRKIVSTSKKDLVLIVYLNSNKDFEVQNNDAVLCKACDDTYNLSIIQLKKYCLNTKIAKDLFKIKI